jgi:hypothetical protein
LHAHGFARTVCESCGDELLLPFSCKLGYRRDAQARARAEALVGKTVKIPTSRAPERDLDPSFPSDACRRGILTSMR